MNDIDRIIEQVAREARENAEESALDQEQNFKTKQPEAMTLDELLKENINDEDIRQEIYNRFKSDIEIYIDDYLERSKDENAKRGMLKCCLETWQHCATEIGMHYFNRHYYLREGRQKAKSERGQTFNEPLLYIGVQLYADLCIEYRKQFFIYDCCKFLGMNIDSMYRLTEIRSDVLKKAHTMQEGSMRSALASGRSNVTAMAILLNHDYDYTRTTQVIHTTNSAQITADKLPTLENSQEISANERSKVNNIECEM